MADPLSATKALAALRAEGVKVQEHSNWRTHNRNSAGAWGPVNGVMIHHTVTSGTDDTVRICRNGYSGLPGPLCHAVIDKKGVVHLIGWGRTNHAGKGDDDVLSAVIAERTLPAPNEANTDGNTRFYGFECENLGDGKDPWPAAQVEAIVRASAALVRAHGWGRDGDTSVIGHKEWQPGKQDPRGPGISMADIRRRVAERLDHEPGWSPGSSPTPAPTPTVPKETAVKLSDQVPIGDWVKKQWPNDKGLQDGSLTVTTALGSGYAHSRRAAEASDEILRQVEALRNEVAQLRAAVTKGS